MKKRGLSMVVTTLILILLSFVAIGIVWVVVKNVIDSGAEEVTMDSFNLNLEIQNVYSENNHLYVNVKRNPGAGNFDGIKFVLDDGTNSEVLYSEANIAELGSNVFELNPNNSIIKEISIVPTFNKSDGDMKIGNVEDKIEFNEEKTIKNILGIVAWWKLDRGASETISGDAGTINGDVTFVSDSKRDLVGNFDGTNWISMNLDAPDVGTMGAWIKGTMADNSGRIIYPFGWNSKFVALGPSPYPSQMEKSGIVMNPPFEPYIWENQGFYDGKWNFYIVSWNSSSVILYKNGKLIGIQNRRESVSGGTGIIFGIGSGWGPGGSHAGQIDDVMVFDRVLNSKEVEALYEIMN